MINNELSLEELQKLHAQMVFVHQRLVQTSQYFITEFDVAKDSIQTITNYANQLMELIEKRKAEQLLKNESENAKES